ncbi:MAG: hypothetical protein ACOCRO_11200 [Halanaerobiales bacterium]
MRFLHPYMLFAHEMMSKGNKSPEERALKALKRDSNFKYNKENDSYNYKGVEISAEKAINCVVNYSLRELKEALERGK